MTGAFAEPFPVILVEDDEGHARLLHKNLQRVGVLNRIVRLKTGGEALDHIQRMARAGDGPAVVVLDLNLPDIDGFEVLRRLRDNETTDAIPVVVLTTTDNPRDIERGYALGCNVFMTKPVGYETFAGAIARLGLELTLVRVPHIKGRNDT